MRRCIGSSVSCGAGVTFSREARLPPAGRRDSGANEISAEPSPPEGPEAGVWVLPKQRNCRRCS